MEREASARYEGLEATGGFSSGREVTWFDLCHEYSGASDGNGWDGKGIRHGYQLKVY